VEALPTLQRCHNFVFLHLECNQEGVLLNFVRCNWQGVAEEGLEAFDLRYMGLADLRVLRSCCPVQGRVLVVECYRHKKLVQGEAAGVVRELK
jgi:hypothetical protein